MDAGMDLNKLFALAGRFREEAEKAHERAKTAVSHEAFMALCREADIWREASVEITSLAGDIIAQREHEIRRAGL